MKFYQKALQSVSGKTQIFLKVAFIIQYRPEDLGLLTRVRRIRFLEFEIKKMCWSIIQQSLNLRICLFYTFHSKRIADKKVLKKKR